MKPLDEHQQGLIRHRFRTNTNQALSSSASIPLPTRLHQAALLYQRRPSLIRQRLRITTTRPYQAALTRQPDLIRQSLYSTSTRPDQAALPYQYQPDLIRQRFCTIACQALSGSASVPTPTRLYQAAPAHQRQPGFIRQHLRTKPNQALSCSAAVPLPTRLHQVEPYNNVNQALSGRVIYQHQLGLFELGVHDGCQRRQDVGEEEECMDWSPLREREVFLRWS